ncbi:mismatch repair protein [Aspergillus sclerotialis]|uniref:Mismatch repair protein n=1 Tax=Aspergillus sclerotialis TaxID=2070753 RepID=A0A3A2ZBH3_9EURO|nr:mismatch repair protein [Aspergillus sclerotialis]
MLRFPKQGQLPESPRDAWTDNRGLELSTDDDLDQVIVAIDKKDSGTVGCSYYSAEEETLYLMGDIRFAGAEVIDSCESKFIGSLSREKY